MALSLRKLMLLNPLATIERGINNLKQKIIPWKDRDLLIKIKKQYMIKNVSVDSQNRITITTQPIYIKVNRRNKVAGQYQIRINFKNSTEMIRILNISQRYYNLDNPTISDTKPCWGSGKYGIKLEIEKLWVAQNLQKLVDTCLYYIASVKSEDAGYTNWDEWLKGATPCPRGFDFDQYDRGIRQASYQPQPRTQTAPSGIQEAQYTQATYQNQLNGLDTMRAKRNMLLAELNVPYPYTRDINFTNAIHQRLQALEDAIRSLEARQS